MQGEWWQEHWTHVFLGHGVDEGVEAWDGENLPVEDVVAEDTGDEVDVWHL